MVSTFDTGDIRANHEKAIDQAVADRWFGAWIGGETRAADANETFAPRDPAIDEPITPVARCRAADVDIAADIEAGSIWINRYFGTVPGTPFGGFDNSGIGRECAQSALEAYTRSKAVNMALDDPAE